MMKITEQALRDNGWEQVGNSGDFIKRTTERVTLIVTLWIGGEIFVFLEIYTKQAYLPHITTLEQLAQLEYLLSDKSPYQASLETLPEPLRGLAPAIDEAYRVRLMEEE